MRRVKSSTVALSDVASPKESDKFSRLPSAVSLHILQHLHAQDLLALSACSRLWQRRCSDNDLWLRFCEKEGVCTKTREFSRSPLPWKSLSNKLRSFSPFSAKSADSDVPPGCYKKAYLKVLSNWTRNKSSSCTYSAAGRLGAVVRGDTVVSWSASDVLVIFKRSRKTATLDVAVTEAAFFDGVARLVVRTSCPSEVQLRTFSLEPLEPLRCFSFPPNPLFSLRACLHGHCVAVSDLDKVDIIDLRDGSLRQSVPLASSSQRFVEFDGVRVLGCCREAKRLEVCSLKEPRVHVFDQVTDFKLLSDIKQVILFYVRWKCEVLNVDTMEKLESLTASCGDFADIHRSLHYRGRTLVGLMGGPPGTGALFPVVNVWNFDGYRWKDKGVILRGLVRDVGFVSSHLFLCEARKSERGAPRFQLWHVRKATLVANLGLPWDPTLAERPLSPQQLNGSTVALATRDGVVVVDFN